MIDFAACSRGRTSDVKDSALTVGERSEFTPDEVDLWLVPSLDCPAGLQGALGQTLSGDESDRAARFHFAQDRNRFIAARSILREILSFYLNCCPAEVCFAYQPNGKPHLRFQPLLNKDLRFNLSHSGEVAMYAISRGREIGVDVELSRLNISWAELAGSFFATGEVAALHRLSAKDRMRGFFNCWTRKEAYVKARGEGLSIPLDAFEVSLAPTDPPALCRVSDPKELERWSLWDLGLTGDLAGALVVEGKPSRFRLFSWSWADSSQSGTAAVRLCPGVNNCHVRHLFGAIGGVPITAPLHTPG